MNETWSKTCQWKFILNLQDVTPPCVSCTVQRRQKQAEPSMNKKVESDCFTLKRRQFHTWVQATSLAHRWSRAPKFSHLCGVGPLLVKMLPLTSWDSPTILFWLVQVLHRLIAICQSAAWVLGIQEPTFRRKLSQHPVLRCVRGQGPNIFSGTTKSVLSPEYCRHIWKVASMAVFDLESREVSDDVYMDDHLSLLRQWGGRLQPVMQHGGKLLDLKRQ